jgi:hypothetical protein
MLYHRQRLYRTEMGLRKMEKRGDHIQLHVTIILFFCGFVLSRQKTMKSFSQKASEPSQGGCKSIKGKGTQYLSVCKHNFSLLISYCSIVMLLFSHFPC